MTSEISDSVPVKAIKLERSFDDGEVRHYMKNIQQAVSHARREMSSPQRTGSRRDPFTGANNTVITEDQDFHTVSVELASNVYNY